MIYTYKIRIKNVIHVRNVICETRYYQKKKIDLRGVIVLRPLVIFAKQSVRQNFGLFTAPHDRTDNFPRVWRSMRAHVRVYENVPFERGAFSLVFMCVGADRSTLRSS
jgi:hypothetical protein